METKILSPNELEEAADLLRNGEVVAFPTETVYGLGADATDEEAVNKVFEAKGRPADNPLIAHVSSVSQALHYVKNTTPLILGLMEEFWPGPLTLVLEHNGLFASNVTADLKSVGLRMPNNSITLKLIEKVSKPIVGPSANTSGRPSPTSAHHVYHDMKNRIAAIVDNGETGLGLESTVLDLTDEKNPIILRPGAIGMEDLQPFIPNVTFDEHLLNEDEAPKSPGMKYTHYSPTEPVYIIQKDGIGWEKAIQLFEKQGEKVGLLASEEIIQQYEKRVTNTFSLGSDIHSASRLLYAGLRYFENLESSVILAESYAEVGIGKAYMNRLKKAAGNKYL
ncbi:L-threonylcarbamoyladenylate synthase [Lacticigenium naphthae]|uniref:L-threonylcarbamoyladenylate synthase n=1 Tax=Lacticigenium naphthae TaxID=515351 RepID=UPI000486CAA7|nr:L-threonylcarbamoyladenylate synthase [Lacticigenium naphthae]